MDGQVGARSDPRPFRLGETLAPALADVKQVIWPELWLLPLHGGMGWTLKPPVNLHSKLEQWPQRPDQGVC